jgi:hypothetical protein
VARPEVSSVTEEFYASLGVWARADTIRGETIDRWELLEFCESIGGLLQPLDDIIQDTDDGPGWSIVMDVDRAPADWLGWLAQFVGVRLRAGLTLGEQRDRIKSTDGFRRGTPSAIIGAAQQFLTGDKQVFLIERHGSAWALTVATLASETPDPAKVEYAVREQKPAGIVMNVVTVAGDDYDYIANTHATYTALLAAFDTYAELAVGT